jgi:aspartate kinase
MKVFKFGGASVKDADAIRNTADIIRLYPNEEIVIVISAMGKITNALEEVVRAYFHGEGNLAEKWQFVKEYHYTEIDKLFAAKEAVYDDANALFEAVEQLFSAPATLSYDCVYDQIVSLGELISTTIVSHYLNVADLPSTWVDARQLIRTNDTFREGKVDWEVTPEQFKRIVKPLLTNGYVVTQGFIGGTKDGLTTTLGREGSDFTAAIASFCLDAKNMTVWKDVPGILTADPRLFKNATKLDRISFLEAIEMTYYGAKVIHPKTIKPLQNKSIPLLVKSFIDPKGEGTMISENLEAAYPPVIVVEQNQALLQVSRTDFSFVDEESLSELFALFAHHRIKVNMMQNTAIGFSICIDNVAERIHGLMKDLQKFYKVFKDNNVELVTVRHYEKSIVEQLKKGKMILLEERIRGTLKMVVKNVPIMERINR